MPRAIYFSHPVEVGSHNDKLPSIPRWFTVGYITNTVTGSFAVGWGAKQELIEFAVRDRAGLSRSAFEELGNVEKTAAEVAALGKSGVKYLKFVKGVGYVGGAVTSGIAIFNAGKYYLNGGQKASVGIKAALDVVMTVVGFLGPIGFGISSAYFIIDAASNHFGGYGSTE